MSHPPPDRRKLRQRLAQPQMRIARKQHRANFVLRHRRNVKLAAVAPVDLHELGPRRHPVMAAETVAQALPRAIVQASPAANARMPAIRTHNPARRHALPGRVNSFAIHPRHRGAPRQPHPRLLGVVDQHPVQRRPPYPHPIAAREPRFHRSRTVAKADAWKTPPRRSFQVDPQRSRRRQSIRHDPFAARLVDRRPRGVRHGHIQAASPRGNRGGEPRRAAADNE